MSGYVLAKASGTLFKSGGPSSGRSTTSSTWKQAPLGSKLHLEAWVFGGVKQDPKNDSGSAQRSLGVGNLVGGRDFRGFVRAGMVFSGPDTSKTGTRPRSYAEVRTGTHLCPCLSKSGLTRAITRRRACHNNGRSNKLTSPRILSCLGS